MDLIATPSIVLTITPGQFVMNEVNSLVLLPANVPNQNVHILDYSNMSISQKMLAIGKFDKMIKPTFNSDTEYVCSDDSNRMFIFDIGRDTKKNFRTYSTSYGRITSF